MCSLEGGEEGKQRNGKGSKGREGKGEDEQREENSPHFV